MSGFLSRTVLKSLTAILNFFNSKFEEPLIFKRVVEFGYFFIELSISLIISPNFLLLKRYIREFMTSTGASKCLYWILHNNLKIICIYTQ